MEALKLTQMPPSPPPQSATDISSLDRTAFTDAESEGDTTPTAAAAPSSSGATKGILKKKGKPKLTNKEKKERAIEIERIVSSLPLEFRGSDPTLRRHIEMVIEGFLDRLGRGVPSTSYLSCNVAKGTHGFQPSPGTYQTT